MSAIELMQLLLIVIVIGLPPYWIVLKDLKGISKIVLIIFSMIYWIGTFYTQQIVPFIVIVFIYIKNRKKALDDPYNVKNQSKSFGFKDFIRITILTTLIRFPIGIVNLFYLVFIEKLGLNIEQQEIIDVFINSENNLLNMFLIILVVIVAPINEEFSLRHWFFYRVLSPRIGMVLAAIFSSVLFTLLHYNIAGVPTFFILGLYACYVYYHNGLKGAVTVHLIFNLSSVMLLILSEYFLDFL